MKTTGALCLWYLRTVLAESSSCDYFHTVESNTPYTFSNPNYPENYAGGLQCRWIIDCPTGHCELNCTRLEIPRSESCEQDRLVISRTGDAELADAERFCHRGSISGIASIGERMIIGLKSDPDSSGGRFMCEVTAQQSTPSRFCNCGARREVRIVGGEETAVNEYPMMVGLADMTIPLIMCGGAIISEWHVLTAAHCTRALPINDTSVLVGAHDITSPPDPSAMREHSISSYIKHPLYNQSILDYDIAIVTVTDRIQFNDFVGPVCLPFKFMNKNFTGENVIIMGWGLTEQSGAKSEHLRHVEVEVASQSRCEYRSDGITDRKFCTYTPGKDACQFDSGGPVVYTDPATGLLFQLGIVSSGLGCGGKGIHTRVPPRLDWIVATTNANFCVR